MSNDAKLVIVGVVALMVVAISLTLMPWAESGFGFEPQKLPEWSQHIFDANGPFASLKPLGDWAQQALTSKVDKGDLNKSNQIDPILAGNYMYALAMGAAMTLAAIAIMYVGKEDAEEKTILPVKK